DAVGAALPETAVVLAAAALVGIALDQHLRALVLAQVLRMRLDQGTELVLDVELVELVVDRAPGQDVVRVLERVSRRWLAGQVDARDRLGFDRGGRFGGPLLHAYGRLLLGRGSATRGQRGCGKSGDDGSAHGIASSSFHSSNGPEAGP